MNMNHRPCDAEPLPEQLRVFHPAAAEQVRQFHQGMAGYAETPLRELKGLAGTLGLCKLLVKPLVPVGRRAVHTCECFK